MKKRMIEVECPNGMRPVFETQEDADLFATGYRNRWPEWNESWASKNHPFTFRITEVDTNKVPEDFTINDIMDEARN